MINRTSIIKQPDNISFFNDVYEIQKEYQDSFCLLYTSDAADE